jgi:hypothetical protein
MEKLIIPDKMSSFKELSITIENAGGPVIFKIRDTHDLAKLVEAWCQRTCRDPKTMALRVVRTGRCITLFDSGIKAFTRLEEGDLLQEVV